MRKNRRNERKNAKKDILRNKVITVTLFVFILLAALLFARAARVITELFGSLDSLFEKSSVSHFVQMHSGEIDQSAIDRFAVENAELVKSQQTVEMLNINGAKVAAKTKRVLFMMDGRIVAEKKLGKYNKTIDDIRRREALSNEWLLEQGF